MKRILIATPSRHSLPIDYIEWVLARLQKRIPDVELRVRFATGTSVNIARNELAHVVMEEKYDEVVMVDDDMKPTAEQFERLIAHDVDVVSGPYCKRKGGKPNWTFTPKADGEKRGDLFEAMAFGSGFLRIHRCVFERLREAFPEREYFHRASPGSDEGRMMFEYFPMGIIGPRTADTRLATIKELLVSSDQTNPKELLDRIQDIAFRPEKHGAFLGEDFYFCYLCYKAGVRMWIDSGMPPVPHLGTAAYPITEDQVGMRSGDAQEVIACTFPS